MTDRDALSEDEIIRQFHLLWYERRQEQTWKRTHWFGAPLQQCPFDLWTFQEMIAETKPEVFVELGVKRGGTTLYIANLFDLVYGDDRDKGIVVGVDVHLGAVDNEARRHPRVRLIEGSSTDEGVVANVASICRQRRTMVIADSDHSAPHVLAELRAYGPLVTAGCYMVVSDTNINGHPASEGWGPGPYEAVEEFMQGNRDFVIDEGRERHLLTLNPRGFLLRRGRIDRLVRRS
jgi:cephalosporin hydroxylase